jgi:ribosomal peptide maturation radical SAM protein 1
MTGRPAAKPVALVSMPTLSTYVPSFQLGLLAPTLERAGVDVHPLSLFLHFGARIGPRLNDALATVYPCMVGEWIWSKTAFGEFSDDAAYLRHYRSNFDDLCRVAGCTLDDIVALREEAAPAFVDWAVDAIDWSAYGLVGFTIVFQQMVASLALAKALKRRHPDLPIIFGGATFEDDIASEVVRNNPEVDFVHCGDADLSLPEFVSRLYAGQSMAGLAGLMYRKGNDVVYEGRAPNLEDLDLTPVPDFDEYFDTLRATGMELRHADVMLPIETARGCWYGMKQHCTFCGLNRAGMKFRRKDPDRVLTMLRALANRYGTRHFNAIDNILAPAYVSRLFGRLADAHSDLRLHYEIRPTVTRPQLEQMRRGGLRSVQPGIESFSTHVLSLMRKNTTAMRNLELLKWTTYYGISNSYNILYGFPGETEQDYEDQAAIIRLIPHLQPPYSMCQARPDRGSPMFEQPEEFSISVLRPSACYAYIYPPEYNRRRISYFFEHGIAGTLPDGGYDECLDLVADWTHRWREPGRRPYLYYVKTWDSISVHDGRAERPSGRRFDGAHAAVYEECADAKGRDEIAAAVECDGTWLDGVLQDFVQRRLMAFADGQYLALALPQNPYY